MGLPDGALQKGLVALIDNAVDPIQTFDVAPAEQALPYITIGDIRSRDISTKTTEEYETSFVIQAWSGKRSSKEARELINQIHDALMDLTLVVEGHRVVELYLEQSEGVFVDEDGTTRRGLCRYRAIIQTI